jgi:hypothetical protein
MISDKLRKRLCKNRPKVTINLEIPEDVLEELTDIAQKMDFSDYQSLIRFYIGQNLRMDATAMDKVVKDRKMPTDVTLEEAQSNHEIAIQRVHEAHARLMTATDDLAEARENLWLARLAVLSTMPINSNMATSELIKLPYGCIQWWEDQDIYRSCISRSQDQSKAYAEVGQIARILNRSITLIGACGSETDVKVRVDPGDDAKVVEQRVRNDLLRISGD